MASLQDVHHAAAAPAVELSDVVATLGGYPALAGVDLTVGRGEVVALRGPNGAGKTTVLRVCAGLCGIARGAGRVLGLDLVDERAAVRERVGLIGHRNGLYGDLTVAENVRFWGATVGATTREIGSAMAAMAVDGRLADVQVRSLSAGQRRRTALAVLMVRRAELWLLDEPHSGLDATGRDELDLVLRLAADAGATIVVASHEIDRVAALASRTVTIESGRVAEDR
ncbi:MAG: cytochrome c biosis ATP-binding export protein CcmA [Actinomycetota bacterium]|jgi:heme ABC exporter ATP-binding subunit CcmA